MQELIKQAGKLDYVLKESNRKLARGFLEMNNLDAEVTSDTIEKLRALWQDPAIHQAWEQGTEYLMHTTMMSYHMEHLEQYISSGFVPTKEDVLRSRQRTTGATSISCQIDNGRF